jgi:branched-chain amino acid transport system substrate-binding protein
LDAEPWRKASVTKYRHVIRNTADDASARRGETVTGTGHIGRRRVASLATALCAALGVAACGGSSSTSSNVAATQTSTSGQTSTPTHASTSANNAGTPFRVLGFYPTSGASAVPGIEELAGLQAGAAVINAEGGILGHRVVITVNNDQNTGTTAVSQAQQVLASGTKYSLIVPGIDGADAIPVAAVLAHTPVLQVTPAAESALNQPSKYPYLFMALNNFPVNEQSVAAELKAKGITKVAFITGDDPSGQNAEQDFDVAAKSAGINVTANLLVPDTAVDAKPQLQKALASGPQALVTGAYTPAEPVILAARAQLGNTLPWYLDAFAAAFPLEIPFKQPAQMHGIVLQQFPYLVKGSAAQSTAWWQKFSAAFLKADPKPLINQISGVVSYNALMLARAAAVKANSIDGSAMAKALEQISAAGQVPDFVGDPSTGIFSATNHQLAAHPSNFGFFSAGPTLGGLLEPLG